MLRRLHPEQPDSFAFTPDNLAWAEAQIGKYPEGREASAVIPLLWRAQEQEGWVTRPAIEAIAGMLNLAFIRVLEVASFYFMFQLRPVGSVAHVQVCGTTSCMICGAEDLVALCKEKIAPKAHELSADGKFSWEEVECLGACSNAPMAQIGKDYYEDLTVESFGAILDAFARGEVPAPGPANGRFASEPLGGVTSLAIPEAERVAENASRELARVMADTVGPITDGRGISRPGGSATSRPTPSAAPSPAAAAVAAEPAPAPVEAAGDAPDAAAEADRPAALDGPRDGAADDLKLIKGVGPKLEALLHSMGFYHFDQIAAWTEREIGWVDANLEGFKGRVTRDRWVAQAAELAGGHGAGDA